MQQTLTIRRPDDFHLHLRDGALMKAVLPATSQDFARAIIMPNLTPPVVTSADAGAYRGRILNALPAGHEFQPLMTLYLTESSDPADIAAAAASGMISAVKLYPAGATTNSDSGVKAIDNVMPALERMAQIGLPLLIHGEVTDGDIDIFDREAVFIERVLEPLRRRLPELSVTLEHITTKDGADYVAGADANLFATITVQHLLLNRNDLLVGGVRPHYYCLPILKRSVHQKRLVEVATSGDPRFFLGTDSAPHLTHTKEAPCGCAGCFTAPSTLACLAQLFENEGCLDRLEAYVSEFGARRYGLPLSPGTVTLERTDEAQPVPEPVKAGDETVTCFDPRMDVFWRVAR